MSLRSVIGAALLAAGGWLYYAKRAEASAPADAAPSSDPVQQPPQPVANGPAAYLAIVRHVNAAEYGNFFDPAVIMGVMQTESGFNPSAYRFEPKLNEASYGLMQVLESTARDRGYSGPAEGLFDPETSIRLGMAQLFWSYNYLLNRKGEVTLDQLLSSYNAGVGYVSNGGIRLAYVGKVTGYAANWRAVA
jgi:soluble lytic murein transglycosylase-like protein